MARNYWTPGPATAPDEQSLDAHTARKLLIGNAECAYEIGCFDISPTLPAKESVAAAGTYYYGPHRVFQRRDRNGLWRPYHVEPLAGAAPVAEGGYLP